MGLFFHSLQECAGARRHNHRWTMPRWIKRKIRGCTAWHAIWLNLVWFFANCICFCISECDNCAQTLLHDLEELDNDLVKIKAELGNATASASSQDRLKKLEKAMADTKVTH